MLPNKALQLLVRGLPLLVRGMPDFIEAPFVLRAEDRDPVELVEGLRARFDALQPSIRAFVSDNSAERRLRQFLGYLG